jgi:hypothetical protein
MLKPKKKHLEGDDRLPHLTGDLLEWLDQKIPKQCIRAGESLEEAHRYAGKRELVSFLLKRFLEENEEIRSRMLSVTDSHDVTDSHEKEEDD